MCEGGALKRIFVYDGTFAGILCAVHRAYYSRCVPDDIVLAGEYQRELFASYEYVETDKAKYDAVCRGIQKKISQQALQNCYHVFLSSAPERAMLIYRYLRVGFQIGRQVDKNLANDWVHLTLKTAAHVTKEAHRLMQFIRFSKTAQGILFARIAPVNNVLELICPHFADRLIDLPWVIYDEKRSLAAVYDTTQWMLDRVNVPVSQSMDEEEQLYQALWKQFAHTIGIRERKNESLRIQMMPKRYWKNMTEFQS